MTPRRPWGSGEAFALTTGNVTAISFVIGGWLGMSNERLVEGQLPWVALAGAGALIAGLSNASWLVAGRRTVAERQAAIFGARLPVLVARLSPGAGVEVAAKAESSSDLVATQTMLRYHRPWCPLADGKNVVAATRTEHERCGRIPCEACRP